MNPDNRSEQYNFPDNYLPFSDHSKRNCKLQQNGCCQNNQNNPLKGNVKSQVNIINIKKKNNSYKNRNQEKYKNQY